jgi:Amt family ammonium transporter
VDVGASLVIGAAGAIASNVAVHIKTKSTLDDTLDVFPCHGVGGLVGMLLTAVFAKEGGAIHGGFRLLGYHGLTLVIVSAFVFAGSYALLKLVNLVLPLRVSRASEEAGLDISQHGESIYEDSSHDDMAAPLSGRMSIPPYDAGPASRAPQPTDE